MEFTEALVNKIIEEAAQVPISRWGGKPTVRHWHNGILFGLKKGENFTLCDSMDGPREYYAKWNKPVKETQSPFDLTHMCTPMNRINWGTKQNQRHGHMEQAERSQRGEGVRGLEEIR